MAEQGETLVRLKRHFQGCSVTPKLPSKRVGVEAWFPYYAGYSSDFVREALAGLGVKPGWRILDPWNGFGTTTAVADALGCDALGFDINPVAALVATARLARADDVTHSFGLAVELLAVASRERKEPAPGDPLLAWLSPRLVRRYRSIENAILELLGCRGGSLVKVERVTPPPFASFFLLCLIRAAKRFLRLKEKSNPTWITTEKSGDAHTDSLDRSFLSMVEVCARDAENASSGRVSTRATDSSISLADARSLPVSNDSVDAVVTSPPYCTRIDYCRATLFELAALGISPASQRFRELRRQAMGTNLMRSTIVAGAEDLPLPIRRVLQHIKKHPSKASETYYFRSYAQYFADAALSLGELRRVLKQGSCGVLIVQSSYYKEIPIPLGDLYRALAGDLGLHSEIVHRVPVRRILATINSKAKKYEPNRRYTEDVVVVQRTS